ncbi:MAG: DUF2075 domain-containing protein [Clostridia bacterium]|nr:DUF2075 domain-containing protein [Clostridia bacterium]
MKCRQKISALRQEKPISTSSAIIDLVSIHEEIYRKYHYTFNGKTAWNEKIPDTENKQEQIKYMLNAYRVLFTRAKAGMVICVPSGNPNKNPSGFWEDSTCLPKFYDGTYQYLKSLGIEEI